MNEQQALVLFLRIIGARRRLRVWEVLPPSPFRDTMIQREQDVLARLTAQEAEAV